MINIHGQGYYGALAAGAQTVMISFNSWTNEALGINEGKLHGSSKAITEILKGKMGFDGLVGLRLERHRPGRGLHERELPAGDQRRHRHRDGPAGLEGVHRQHRRPGPERPDPDGADRRRGHPHPARQAARRAVRRAQAVRARARRRPGCARPSRAGARGGARSRSCCSRTRATCCRSSRSAKVLVVGKSADSLPNQTGGWSLTWQGTGNSNADFPNGTTILARPARGARRRERHVRRGRRGRRPVAVRRGGRRDRRDAVRGGRRRHRHAARSRRRSCTRATSRRSTA